MKSRGRSYHAWLLGSAAATAIMWAGSAAAEDAQFDIAPQPLASALNEFSVQSKQSVLFTTDLAQAKASPGVSGQVEVADALSSLLAGTGLTWKRNGNTFLIVSASDPQSGSAAGAGADQGTVQALIVTAQKREENIQDVPIAMSAFTQEDLTRSQVAGGPDLMTQVPNFTFTKTNFTSYSIQIRGIGTQAISATVDPAVAVAFNNTPFIRNRFFEQEFYDLQRVEVLRGPQGTLYGRNATAGVVNLISEKPKFSYAARLSADIGNYNSSRLEGMVNVPLVDDKVALRLAGAWTKRDGYDLNQLTGKRIDGRNLWSTRLSLRFTPTDKLDVNLIWEHFNENDDRLRSGKQLCKTHEPATIGGYPVYWGHVFGNNGLLYDEVFSQGCEAASLYSPDSFQVPDGLRLPYYRALGRFALPTVAFNPDGTSFDPYASTTQSHDLRTIESSVEPVYRAETNTVELQFTYDLTDHLTLNSETGWLSDTLFSSEDYNRFNTSPGAFGTDPQLQAEGLLDANGNFCDPQIGCANRLVAMDLSTADSTQFSQELRLASNFEGPFNFSLGANFLRYDTEDKYYVFINALTLAAANRGIAWGGAPIPYIGGVSDNHQCLPRGFASPDPTGVQGIENCTYIDPNPITSLNDLGHNYFLSRNPYKLISYAVFGEAYYNITDNLKLTAGLRWTVDKKQAPRIPSWVLAANTVGYPVAEVIKQEWREPTGRLTVDWKPHLSFTDETLLYGSFAHGYKAGGANPPASGLVLYNGGGGYGADWSLIALQQAAVAPKTFKPEFVNAYEIGSKNTLLDGRLTLNGDVFSYDYTGYQISQIVNRAAINLNFDAKIWGAELETDWRPVENLRLGLKFGYERTRMANGSNAVDMIDRANGGQPDANGIRWFVTGPFPTLPSNCILPVYASAYSGSLQPIGNAAGGGLTGCELAYTLGLDPVTGLPYTPNPTVNQYGQTISGYPGFDPHTAPNGGAGISKDLSGHELPNAPHFTTTLTADYTIPLPNSWLMTLHTDLYYQSEAWTRVFNTPGYDKLKAYTNVNIAAIFSNEDAGWKVMAYVKNIFDKDNITGAFLNSDDTGLTTNVFLNEPRLYGLRVTKEWSGGPWWTGATPNHTGPYPLTIELNGEAQKQDALYDPLRVPPFLGAPAGFDPPSHVQNRDFDWGDGRSVKVTYQPTGSPWSVSGSLRYSRTNNNTAWNHGEYTGVQAACAVPAASFFGYLLCNPASSYYKYKFGHYTTHSSGDASAHSREEHDIVDFQVGRDFGVGALLAHSTLVGGLRFADFQSRTHLTSQAFGGWNVPDGWLVQPITFQIRDGHMDALRKFRGAGPTLSWDAGAKLLGSDAAGQVTLDWTVTSGILFGRQKNMLSGTDKVTTFRKASDNVAQVGNPVYTDLAASRSRSASVPFADLALGLAYNIQRIKVGAGYRWERYYHVLDAGFDAPKSYDRTIQGPYFKIAVGFGG